MDRPTAGTTILLRLDGRERPYLLRAPAAARAGRSVPILVELHGRGVDALTFDRMTGFGSLADDAGFALALPSAIGGVWNDGRSSTAAHGPDDVDYLVALIDDACSRLPIDRGRVYMVGARPDPPRG